MALPCEPVFVPLTAYSRRSVVALAAMASVLVSCSAVLDFGSFRFADDVGAVDARGVMDAGAVDVAPPDAPGVDDRPSADIPVAPIDVDLPQDVPVPPIDIDAPQDVPTVDVPVDRGPADVPVDIPIDVPVDRGPADVPVDRGPADVGPPDVPPPAPRSCVEVLARGGRSSGFYVIDHDDSAATRVIQVYCDQVREGGGWLRMIDLSNGTSCPAPLMPLPAHRVCARTHGPDEIVRAFTIAPVIPFREVRGRAALRGRADLDAFGNSPMFLTWESAFVDGLTVSRLQDVASATRRQHVFTWALTSSTRPLSPVQACPCAGGTQPIPQVGSRYLCRALLDGARDAGVIDPMAWRDPETPWVGSGATCARGDVDGWFLTDLGSLRTAPLEVRLTVSGPSSATGEEVGVSALELYVR